VSKRNNTFDFDLIVLGSGSGGGVAANIAARKGKKVAIFEKEHVVGGECPNWACVPTKALLHSAHAYQSAKNSDRYGIKISDLDYDYRKVRQWKDLVVRRTGTHNGDESFAENGVKVFHADARFISPHEITADGKRYKAHKFLIATGTNNFIPPVEGLATSGYITFRQAINLNRPPSSIFIIGGGAIGVEFAQLFWSFGSKVHLIEASPRLLGREEPESAELVKAIFQARGVDVITSGSIVSIKKHGLKKAVTYIDDGKEHRVTVEEILVASGKRPNVDIGLENAGVKYDEKRGIAVDAYMQTSAKHIFAAGDVVGPYQFTHTASYQSRIVGNNLYAQRRNRIAANYSAITRCIFLEPEVASVGITEQQAKDNGIKPKVGITPISIVGRSNTSNSSTGFVKIVADPKGRILGGTIIAPRAGEMIHEIALAVHKNLTAEDISSMVHAFPTWNEAIRIAATKIH